MGEPLSLFSIDERLAAGKALRTPAPRSAHAAWDVEHADRDPLEILRECNFGRLEDLIPLRYGRMLRSPFTFLRGSPSLMAHDLAKTPVTGIMVQACGDCHLANFGLFATPERNLNFDINDFDETLGAPWEWDLKRLATSFVVAGRSTGVAERRCLDAAVGAARSYRLHLAEFARMSPLEIWYYRVSAEDLIAAAPEVKSRARREAMALQARRRIGAHLFPKITREVDGAHHFIEQPPITVRVTDTDRQAMVRQGIAEYRETLSDERRVIFDRYRLEDFARRVVGIGSVGTRCYVGLFFCDDSNSLLLQVKEARRSVLEAYATASPYQNQGQRVVAGQRLMQAASDMFLGWVRTAHGHDYYVRQLRDMKFSVPLDELSATQLEQYAEICGWTLARAHARSGDAGTITGYLGRADTVDQAIGSFAVSYADQTERDHAALVAAYKAGKITAQIEDQA